MNLELKSFVVIIVYFSYYLIIFFKGNFFVFGVNGLIFDCFMIYMLVLFGFYVVLFWKIYLNVGCNLWFGWGLIV